ncbi:MAG: phasin family protein [Wenzhouxiangellaceae bacterium]|nr:phasin family protein [Wenzhouxiangellaceae bacterium]
MLRVHWQAPIVPAARPARAAPIPTSLEVVWLRAWRFSVIALEIAPILLIRRSQRAAVSIQRINEETIMAKKTAKKKVAKKKVAKKTASVNRVQDNAHEIWLAGLGAFSLAQEEGVNLVRQGGKLINEQTGKVISESSKLFERLVAEGKKLEGKGRKLAEDAVGGVRDDVEGRVSKARDQAKTNWDKLEKVFEDRVARALSGLGVPTSDEIQELSKRVAELNKRVAELSKAQKEPAKPAAVKKAAAKPAPAKAAEKPADKPAAG